MKISLGSLMLLLSLMMGACVNDLESIKKVSFDPNDPDERTKDLELVYSDSGQVMMRLTAPIAEMYPKPKNTIQFNKGVLINFYTKDGAVASKLTAKYGEINEDEGKIMVRDSVRLFNPQRDQKLETEALYWNQKDSTIYTDRPVQIRTPKALIFGRGIKTKQDFSTYTFLQPQGKFDIKEEK